MLTPFCKVVTKIDDFLDTFEIEDSSYQKYKRWNSTMKNTTRSPFHPSYLDPITNCFTYSTTYSSSISLRTLEVIFDIAEFQNLFINSGEIRILAHYPGQLVRNMRKHLVKVKNWDRFKDGNNLIMISFSGVTLMRFREHAVDPCNPNILDDDSEWKTRIFDEIGCVPPYWNNNINDGHKTKNICNSREGLDMAKAYWPVADNDHGKKIFANYTGPGYSFQQLSFNTFSSDYKDLSLLKIKIQLQDDFYLEVHNTKAIGIENLFSAIGGVFGSVCGSSILQLARFLIDSVRSFIVSVQKYRRR